MLQKAMMAAAALAAMAVAAATGVIALAFALYALLRGPLGPAGASACVAAVCALAIAVAGLVAATGSVAREEEAEHLGLVERLLDLVRDKPVTTISAAVAAGLLLIRNPSVVGVVLRTLLETWPGPEAAPRRGRRR